MFSFRKYKGSDKYHFRIYKRNGRHPFVVVMITEETTINSHHLVSGYMITHDLIKTLEYPNSYIKLAKNPNPNDDSDCFLCKKRFSNIKDSCFSKPYNNWHLSKEDENLIAVLEEKYKQKDGY